MEHRLFTIFFSWPLYEGTIDLSALIVGDSYDDEKEQEQEKVVQEQEKVVQAHEKRWNEPGEENGLW